MKGRKYTLVVEEEVDEVSEIGSTYSDESHESKHSYKGAYVPSKREKAALNKLQEAQYE